MVLVKILVKVLMSPVGVPEIDAQLWLLPAVLWEAVVVAEVTEFLSPMGKTSVPAKSQL